MLNAQAESARARAPDTCISALAGMATLMVFSGCGKSDAPAAASGLGLSGTFARDLGRKQRRATMPARAESRMSTRSSFQHSWLNAVPASVDFTALPLSCVTSDVPWVTVVGTINAADGTFSVSDSGRRRTRP